MSRYWAKYTQYAGKSCGVLVAQGFAAKFITGTSHVDFCPCCVKFIHRDVEGGVVVEPEE